MENLSELQISEKIQCIDKRLEARSRSFPGRDINYYIVDLLIKEFADLLIEYAGSCCLEKRNVETGDFSWLQEPVFICGAMKSGTSLMANLLDGHSELVRLPADSFYWGKKNQWEKMGFEESARYWIRRLIMPAAQKPYWLLSKDVSQYAKFIVCLESVYNKLQCDAFLNGVAALSMIGNETNKKRMWVEKTPGNEFHVAKILQHYPDAKFINIVRDPLQNVSSVCKTSNAMKWDISIFNCSCMVKNSMIRARKNERLIGKDNYLIIKYENLVSRPSETIDAIARFLNINNEDILQTPTSNGLLSTSNSMYKEKRVTGKIMNNVSGTELDRLMPKVDLETAVSVVSGVSKLYQYSSCRDIRRKGIVKVSLIKRLNIKCKSILYVIFLNLKKFFVMATELVCIKS